MAEVQRATVLAIVEETTAGELESPSAGSDFIPLRAGFAANAEVETLESDELLNDIGASEPSLGKETPTGTHPFYVKHSEVEGQEPEYGLLIESSLGAKTVNATEYDTVGGSTTTVLNVDTGEGALFEEGQAVLIKDSANNFSVRNIDSISGDALTLNFALDNAPASGVNLGKAVLYKPASSGEPSFSAWYYRGNGGAIEAIEGAKTSSLTMTMEAGQLAVGEFSFEGTGFFFNPVVITSSNNLIDFTDDVGTVQATLSSKAYKSPIDLSREIASKMTAASVGSGDDTITCTYDNDTGVFTIASDGTTFSLLWNTGAGTANSVGATIGFDVSADDTGATSYAADNALSLAAPFTPSFDNASNIRVVNAELMIGGSDDNVCIEASTVEITVDRPTVDVPDICEQSGVAERIPESRSVTMTATATLKRYESEFFDRFINNQTTQVMVNIGPKSNDNWVAGKAANIYMQAAKITGHVVGGDTFVTVEITANGFVNSDAKDLFINFM